MTKIKLLDNTVDETLAIVRELKDRGYVQGTDFDFTYYPPEFDNISGHAVYNRYVVFTFYKEELASWFSLIYS